MIWRPALPKLDCTRMDEPEMFTARTPLPRDAPEPPTVSCDISRAVSLAKGRPTELTYIFICIGTETCLKPPPIDCSRDSVHVAV